MPKSNSLKQTYLTPVALAKDSQRFAEEVAKRNPGIEGNSKLSLIALSSQSRKLSWEFARLGTELREMYEAKAKE